MFNEWLENSPTGGAYVTDITLNYANRAQDSLWSDPPNGWTLLTKTAQLTISSLVANMPADFGMPIHVYSDDDSDGKPDRYYFKDGRLIDGFKFTHTFTKAAGHSDSITFYQAPIEPVYLDYQVKLTAFVGTGTEYLFFPMNLMLGKMQYLRCIDKGILNEWAAFEKEYHKELKRFKAQHQNPVSIPEITVKDFSGKEVFIPRYDLQSGLNNGGKNVSHENDRDSYRY
jgi:hypothetical protein